MERRNIGDCWEEFQQIDEELKELIGKYSKAGKGGF